MRLNFVLSLILRSIMKKQNRIIPVLIISGIITAVIAVIMNLYLIPEIEKAAGGLKCFDMRFGYTYDDAKAFLGALSADGRALYSGIQLPLDFVYPIAYGVFFISLTYFLLKKKTPLFVLPGLLMIFDYIENICIAIMLKDGDLTVSLVSVASVATVIKTVLMYGCFLMIIILLIRRMISLKKKK